jgi:hypothetical protein
MKTARILTTMALAFLFAGPIAALAQQAQPSPQTVLPPTPPPAASVSDARAPLGSDANPIPRNSPTPVEQAGRLVAGGPTVVSNAPVPDTVENRARYGQPLSATGRANKPAGN